jgi:hypothetical protein
MKRETDVSSSDVKLLGFKLLGYYFFSDITTKTSSTIETKPRQFNSICSIKTHFLHVRIPPSSITILQGISFNLVDLIQGERFTSKQIYI